MLTIYTNNIRNLNLISNLFDGFDYKIADKNEYQSNDINFKVGFYYDLINDGFGSNFGHEINDISSKCDLVFLYSTEFHAEHLQMLKLCHDNKHFYYICPAIPYYDLKILPRIIFNGFWFEDNCRIYKKLDYKLQELNPYKTKDYYFDALLGTHKVNRKFVFDKIVNSNLHNKFVYNSGNDVQKVILDSDMVIPENVTKSYSLNYFDYNGVQTLFCQIIPTDVYNKTAYSIVAETNFENRYFFPTEKITKPILGRRLFVVFAQHDYLKYLKSLGFKTFSGIIDESYDNIKDSNERWDAAWEQIVQLCNVKQTEVLEQIKWICEYNYNHLISTNWTDNVRNTIADLININI